MNISSCWYKGKCKVESEEGCRQSCVRYNCMEALFKASNLPENLWGANRTLTCYDEDYNSFIELKGILDSIEDWVTSGKNLYIFSKICGNGKTSWAIRLLYGWFDKVWHKSGFDCHGLFINVPKFLYDHKRSINQEVAGFEELCNLIQSAELVIWDDLPSRTLTEYEHQILLQFLDDRINSGLSNIITGNCDKEECIARLGDRLTSRIFGTSKTIEFVECDKRGLSNG